ncbi:MAG: TauD/TfdA family dioxygenase [Gammaproteobacteria bacterium]|nr:TauD/TfdA family dioxygenase [Gammaproteobacteria bacterium]
MTAPATSTSDSSSAGPVAWTARQVTETDYRIRMSDAVRAELLALLDGPAIEDSAGDRLQRAVPPGLEALMQEVRQRVLRGFGLCIVSGLPIEDLDDTLRARLVRSVAYAFGPVIVQDVKHTRFYDVKDTGRSVQYGVRRSKTNVDQELHTDGGWLDKPAEVIALHCLAQASNGGMSRIASLTQAVEQMRQEAPDLLALLERPLPWDRQAEHPPGEQTWSEQPVLWHESSLTRLRWYRDYVQNGYKLAGQSMPDQIAEALNRFFEILARPENVIEIQLQPGEVAWIHNQAVAHARSEFEAGSARHMVRVWHRFDV